MNKNMFFAVHSTLVFLPLCLKNQDYNIENKAVLDGAVLLIMTLI